MHMCVYRDLKRFGSPNLFNNIVFLYRDSEISRAAAPARCLSIIYHRNLCIICTLFSAQNFKIRLEPCIFNTTWSRKISFLFVSYQGLTHQRNNI